MIPSSTSLASALKSKRSLLQRSRFFYRIAASNQISNSNSNSDSNSHSSHINSRFRSQIASMKASSACLSLFLTSSLTPVSHAWIVPSVSQTTHIATTARRSFSSSSSSTSLNMASEDKMDQSFPTWRMETPCTSMEWNELVPAKVSISSSSTAEFESADVIFVGLVAPPKDEDADDDDADDDEDAPPPVLSGPTKDLDASLNGSVTAFLTQQAESFKNGASLGSTTPLLRVVADGALGGAYSILGLGAPPKSDDDKPAKPQGYKLGKALAKAIAAEKTTESVQIVLPEEFVSANDGDADFWKDLSTGLYASWYTDNRYRTGKKVKPSVPKLANVNIAVVGGSFDAAAAQASFDQGQHWAQGVLMTKDIVNAPHNVLNSISLADTARKIADASDCLTCEILDSEACEARGMGAFLGVARGSETPPQFIHITYKPPNTDDSASLKKLGVVGKGLLFDTGGYNIKTAMMEMMKFDCGGAAAVLGAARALGHIQPSGVEVHICVAACENMINEKAMVPSDILTASNGKTIEVMNTDAEGRLTLADALVFCDKELGCDSIIELSTLTGACMISLGQEICGLWTHNDDLAATLSAASEATGDPSWRMPMAKDHYEKQLESKFADLKNIGTRYGGSITAALFLNHFVDAKKPFAHLDIAGPVWSDSEGGATGFGAKLVTEWVIQQGKEA